VRWALATGGSGDRVLGLEHFGLVARRSVKAQHAIAKLRVSVIVVGGGARRPRAARWCGRSLRAGHEVVKTRLSAAGVAQASAYKRPRAPPPLDPAFTS
jgi:hypothetical protein